MERVRTTLKDEKIQLRLERSEKTLIARAARASRTTLTRFMVQNACAAAEHVLADELHFTLPPSRWAAFSAALDRRPRKKAALKKLFAGPDVFTGKKPA